MRTATGPPFHNFNVFARANLRIGTLLQRKPSDTANSNHNLLFAFFQAIGGFCALIGIFVLALPVPIVVNR
jgi:hypothetical protein